ncbi:MAG: hypothetical protein KDF58_00970 [Alphaproteobacteria bacterium]|nr:hypothetical protein [Alphaproteobacteria bacterium]HPF45697.1 hypothetical protein [Emcibacteraceae bacterium]
MMRLNVTILILIAFSALSPTIYAQENSDKNEMEAVKTPDRILLVTHKDCQLLRPYIPDEDVTYKPDQDVRGKRLVSAEIKNENDLMIGNNGYSFYLTHDALKEMNENKDAGLTGSEEGKIILGQVTVKNGDVLWNGQSLKESDKSRIYMLCDQQRKRRPIIKR